MTNLFSTTLNALRSKPTSPRFVTCGVCDGHGCLIRIDWNSSETLPQPVKRACWMCGGAGKHVHPDDLNPDPTPGDCLPPDPSDAPIVEYIGVGDEVTAHGRNGVDYVGRVLMTDPVEGLALVRVWDNEVRTNYTAWWNVETLDLKATASAEAEAA